MTERLYPLTIHVTEAEARLIAIERRVDQDRMQDLFHKAAMRAVRDLEFGGIKVDPDRGFTLISGALHSCNECGAVVPVARRAPHLAWHVRINRLLES